MSWIAIVYATGYFTKDYPGWHKKKDSTSDQLQTDGHSVVDELNLGAVVLEKAARLELDQQNRIDRIDIAWCQQQQEQADPEHTAALLRQATDEILNDQQFQQLAGLDDSHEQRPWRFEPGWLELVGTNNARFACTIESRTNLRFWYLGTAAPYVKPNKWPLSGSDIFEVDDDDKRRGALPDYIAQLARACRVSQRSHTDYWQASADGNSTNLAASAEAMADQQSAVDSLTATGYDLDRTRRRLTRQLNRLAGETIDWPFDVDDQTQQREALARVRFNTDRTANAYTKQVNIQNHRDAERSTKATRINSIVTLFLASIAAALALGQIATNRNTPVAASITLMTWTTGLLAAVGYYFIEAPYRSRPVRAAHSVVILASTSVAWLLLTWALA